MNINANLTCLLVLGGLLVGPAAAQTTDFADGMAGGPDFWQVQGLAEDSLLDVQSAAGAGDVVGQVANGDILRNFGCAKAGEEIWCQVEATDGSALKGWADNSYLREGAPPAEASNDALVPGTNFHATGSVPCTIKVDTTVTSCQFGVSRGQPGDAMVFVTLPSGFVRVISFFADGDVRPDSAVESFAFSRSGDDTLIEVDGGAETYVIPDAVTLGG